MIRIYCDNCNEFTILSYDDFDMEYDEQGKWWGDLFCGECKLVIATIQVDEPGKYRFVKVK